jgi:MYXO-CTERM domain-containing protein
VVDGGVLDGGAPASAGKPFSNGSLEIILKGPNGAVLESKTLGNGTINFGQLGVEVCVKGLRDEVARGAMIPANAPTIEFCKPVSVADLSVSAADKAMYDATAKQICDSVNAANAKLDAANSSSSGCNVSSRSSSTPLAILGVLALGLTLARRRTRR